jgi:hypothetical protein
MTQTFDDSPRPENDGSPWTREQTILAFELYCRIPFSKTKASNPFVKRLAALIRRTPASVARKLGNFGAFDPDLARQNISGLSHGSKLDKQVWDEFHHDWSGLVEVAQRMRLEIGGEDSSMIAPLVRPKGPSTRLALVEQRVHQYFFRDAVLSSYDVRCCVTSLPVPECLVGAHIIPWSVDERRRTDPTNGLCLAVTFERLFDAGLLTVDDKMDIIVHRSLLESRDGAVVEQIASRHGRKINLPVRFAPDPECLRWHRENVFQH